MLNVSALEQANKGDIIKGTVLIRDYTRDIASNDKPYLYGTASALSDIAFKIWTGADGTVEKLSNNNYRGKVCEIDLYVDEFKGTKSYIIKKCILQENESPFNYLPVVYNKDSFVKALTDRLHAMLSPQGYSLVEKILLKNDELFTRFTQEFCAKSHHDNCMNGLLVHTFKVVNIVCFTVQQYGFLTKFNPRPMNIGQYRTDLLIIGALLHDIGKVQEMVMGVYQPNTAISHRILGLDTLAPYKDLIVSIYDEKWYHDLRAIIVQHHDKFGDPCTVLYSKIVSMADMYDTMMTSMGETIETATKEDFGGKFIYFDGQRLSL